MAKIRLGFIGCGGVAQQHFTGIATFEDVEMVAFSDLNAELVNRTAAQYGGQPFTRLEEMFSAVEMDAVYIILPPFAHGPAEFAALERRLPFFVEKPVGSDLGVLREIAAEVEKADLLTSVGYMTRYRQSVQTARAILRDDPAALVYGGWIGSTPRMNAPIHQWWVAKEKSGGQLVEQTTHTVDLVRYLCGEAVEVYAVTAHGFVSDIPGYTIDDASLAVVRLANGGIATFYSACCADGGGGVNLNLYARRHTLQFTGWEHSLRILEDGQVRCEVKGEPDIFRIEDRAFVAALQTGDRSTILCSYADGFRTTRLTLAANEAMATGRPVALT
ncbi:MAG: Gfo/Idh/MocA family oxidoreductase [Armatimonadetes bacterium]|nr:Gfo/Idh/MocA family oxidoreductase [Armatimonadota bacterium]